MSRRISFIAGNLACAGIIAIVSALCARFILDRNWIFTSQANCVMPWMDFWDCNRNESMFQEAVFLGIALMGPIVAVNHLIRALRAILDTVKREEFFNGEPAGARNNEGTGRRYFQR